MWMRFVPAMAGLSVAALAACQPAGPLPQADIAAIQATSDSFAAYLKAGNHEALAALYTEDAVLMPPNERAVTGRAAIRAWMEAFPPPTEFSLAHDAVEGRGDLAYVRGRYQMKLGIEGSPVDSGKYIEIRKKGADGMWRLSVDIFNSNLPPMAAPPPQPAPRRR